MSLSLSCFPSTFHASPWSRQLSGRRTFWLVILPRTLPGREILLLLAPWPRLTVQQASALKHQGAVNPDCSLQLFWDTGSVPFCLWVLPPSGRPNGELFLFLYAFQGTTGYSPSLLELLTKYPLMPVHVI